VNLVLVLDRSGSMAVATGSNPGPNAIDDLKYAAELFVERFDNTRDRIGLVSFGTTSNLDFAPAVNFEGGMTTHIQNLLADNSGTNSPDAVWRAFDAINTLNDPNGLNVIVFFTDGAATNFSATVTPTSGPCNGVSVLGGVQALSRNGDNRTFGLWELTVGPPPVAFASEGLVPGCGFETVGDAANGNLHLLVPSLPTVESHGASITGPRPIPAYVGGFPRTRGDVIRVAAANATINVAAMARQDVSTPVTIFSIGLGGNAPPPAIPLDTSLLLQVSNTESTGNPTFNTNEPVGKTFIAPDGAGLENAFDQVASEVLRLIE
jgi:hypothetical protein